ncbi:hypothetical protein evm_012279 [Chilo suppressalis]|nr:hypothetical protein evm_012279 [Chilo suppressalis]
MTSLPNTSINNSCTVQDLNEKINTLTTDLLTAHKEIIKLSSEMTRLNSELQKYLKLIKTNTLILDESCNTSTPRSSSSGRKKKRSRTKKYIDSPKPKAKLTTRDVPEQANSSLSKNLCTPTKIKSDGAQLTTEEQTEPMKKITIISSDNRNKILNISKECFNGYKFCHYLIPNGSIKQLLDNIEYKLQNYTHNDFCILLIAKNKCKAAWSIINDKKKNLPHNDILQIKIDNKIITNPNIIAQTFNDFFLNQSHLKLSVDNDAISDFLLGVFCLPFTLVGQIYRRFLFGATLCKLIPFLQAVSVSVDVWTLVAISLERYFAICRPLKSRKWQTQCHAYKMIAMVWMLSVALNSPILIVSTLQPMKANAYKCREVWTSLELERVFNLGLDAGLLLIPFFILSFAYCLIVTKLWRGMRHEIQHNFNWQKTLSRHESCKSTHLIPPTPILQGNSSVVCCKNWTTRKEPEEKLDSETKSTHSYCMHTVDLEFRHVIRSTHIDKSIEAKRKVIRMLFVIILEFFVCWTPLHVINTPISVPTAGAQAFPRDEIGRLGHDPPRGPSADWRVLTTADAAGIKRLIVPSEVRRNSR